MSAASVAITLDLYRYVDHPMEGDAAARLDVASQLANAGAQSQNKSFGSRLDSKALWISGASL
jgi:hypothetical protein